MAVTEVDTPDRSIRMRNLLSVKRFHKKHPDFPEGGLRHLIFQSKPRTNSKGEKISGNGMEGAGVILRLGRKILIDEDRFFDWLDAQQENSSIGGVEMTAKESQTQATRRLREVKS